MKVLKRKLYKFECKENEDETLPRLQSNGNVQFLFFCDLEKSGSS